jgi:hypothetical protein
MKFNDLIEIATELSNNSKLTPFQGRITLTYKLPPKLHVKMNEELYIRTKAEERGEELTYNDIIEATIGDVDFVFLKTE